MMDCEDDIHMCLVCQASITGLLNYVNHKKNECPGRKEAKVVPSYHPPPAYTTVTRMPYQDKQLLSSISSTYPSPNYTNTRTPSSETYPLSGTLSATSPLHTTIYSSQAGSYDDYGSSQFPLNTTRTSNQLKYIDNLLLKPMVAIPHTSSLSSDQALFDIQRVTTASTQQAHSDLSGFELSPSIFTTTVTSLKKTDEKSTENLGLLNACIGNLNEGMEYHDEDADTQYPSLEHDKTAMVSESEMNDIEDNKDDSHKAASEKVDDFFQSLELMSKTAPRMEKGSSFSQPLLPISNILGNLTFSSDEEDLGFNFAEDVSLDSLSENSGDEMEARGHHTGGKWKPGERHTTSRSSRTIFRGKWPPGQAPVQTVSRYDRKRSRGGKNIAQIMRTLEQASPTKSPRTKAKVEIKNEEKTFNCTFCNASFQCRYKYSNHCGSQSHKDNVFGKREDISYAYKRGKGKSVSIGANKTMDKNLEETEAGEQSGNDVENNDTEGNDGNKQLDEYPKEVVNEEVNKGQDMNEKGDNNDYEVIASVVEKEQDTPENNYEKSPKEVLLQIHICTICDKKYRNKYMLARHLLTRYHRNRSLKNPKEAFILLETYYKYIVRLSPFQCEICRFYFNKNEEFEKHIRSNQHEKNCEDLIGEMQCSLCKFKTHSMPTMIKHMESGEHETNIGKCKQICVIKESHVQCRCKFCNLVMRSFSRLKHHVQLCHNDRKVVQGVVKRQVGKRSGPVPCPHCYKSYQSQKALELHILRIHELVKPFPCDGCKVEFASKHDYAIHTKTAKHLRIAEGIKNLKLEKSEVGNKAQYNKTRPKRETKRNVTLKDYESSEKEDLNPSVVSEDTYDNNTVGNSLQVNASMEEAVLFGFKAKPVDVDKGTDKSETINYASQDAGEDTDTYYDKDEVHDEGDTSLNDESQTAVITDSVADDVELDGESDQEDILNSDEDWVPEEKINHKNRSEGMAKLKSRKSIKPKFKKYYKPTSTVRSRTPKSKHPTKDKTYKCNHCDFTVTTYGNLRPHYLAEHSTQTKHCDVCDLVFMSIKAFKIHALGKEHQINIEKSGGQKVEYFQCHVCKKKFTNEDYCKFHTAYIHFHLTNEEAVLSENKGQDKTRLIYGDFLDRINSEPGIDVACPECGKKFRKSTFIEHLRIHTNDRPFKCKICDKREFVSSVSLRRHIQGHFGINIHTCELCGIVFKKTDSYRSHTLLCAARKNDAAKEHICETCGMAFYFEHQLKAHRTRHGERTFACTFPGCVWKFLRANELKFHMQSHTGNKPFLCDLCGYSALTKYRLQRHHRTHTGERKYHCEYCTYKAGNTTHLHRHMRIHIGSKPFQCPYCEYACNTHENIRKHILNTKKHQGLHIYPCKFCDYGCNKISEFRVHLVEQHENDVGRDFKSTNLSEFTGLFKKDQDIKRPEAGSKIIQIKEKEPKCETKNRRTKQNDSSTTPIKNKKTMQNVPEENTKLGIKNQRSDYIIAGTTENSQMSDIYMKKLKRTARKSMKEEQDLPLNFTINSYNSISQGTFNEMPSYFTNRRSESMNPVPEELTRDQPYHDGLHSNRDVPSYTTDQLHSFDHKPNKVMLDVDNQSHHSITNSNRDRGMTAMYPGNQGQYQGHYSNEYMYKSDENPSMFHDYCTKVGVSNPSGDDPDAPGNLIIDTRFSKT